ncbi:MAG: hypothetical protein ABIP27_17465 [Flavobacterium circumlabens]|uniref:hypothetical protein n=1 Tax=Flavobacterium circumlabens TaxID=2133765 RepID=UPI003267D60F
MKKEIPPIIKTALDQAAQSYAQSKATTNAGRVLRFFASFLTVDTVVKLFAHKLNNNK